MPPQKNISDKAIVLSRIEYGEKDRIITVLTQSHGKLKAIAKAVRSPKSKLAGGIELFAENDLVLIVGRGDICTLRSSRMEKFFGNITADIDRAMYAYECLKNINKLTVDEEGSEYYPLLHEALISLDDKSLPLEQIKTWFGLKLLDLIGASPNLKTLPGGELLPGADLYHFDFDHQCFRVHASGRYSQEHIKVLRFFSHQTHFRQINDCSAELTAKTASLVEGLLGEHL